MEVALKVSIFSNIGIVLTDICLKIIHMCSVCTLSAL